MELNVENWIEGVRQKPEHIRERYVMLCVALTMSLVIGVWLLTVSESFKNVTAETSDAASSVNTLIPKPADFSLDAMLKSNQPLGTETAPVTGEQFFQNESQQMPSPSTPRFEEGIAPVENKPTP